MVGAVEPMMGPLELKMSEFQVMVEVAEQMKVPLEGLETLEGLEILEALVEVLLLAMAVPKTSPSVVSSNATAFLALLEEL